MKKRFVFVLAAILTVTLAILLCACSNNTPNNPTPPSSGGGDNQNTDGWEKISQIENKDMYTKFLLGFTNIAYEISEDKVKSKGAVTADAQAVFTINDSAFFISVKGKYDCTDDAKIREKAILEINLSAQEDVTEDSRLVTAVIYKDELYLAIGKNKVRFDISSSNWTDYYPYKMEQLNSQQLSNTAGLMASYVKLNKNPVGYTRRNSNKEEYKYSVDVNLKQTLSELCNGLSSITKDEKLVAGIKNFVSSVLGITVEQLEEGDTPDSNLKMDFVISGNQLQSLQANAQVDLSHSDSKLIEEDELEIGLDISDVKITNKYGEGVTIDFVNQADERESYTRYGEAIYFLSVPIKVYNDKEVAVSNNYDFNVKTRIFQDNRHENFIFLEYYNKTDEVVDRALYIYNDVAYIFLRKDGEDDSECIYKFNLDLTDLANRVVANDLGGEQTLDVYEMIAYFLRNLAISNTEIGFMINSGFFTSVWYNFDDMLAYVDGLDEGSSIADLPDVQGFIDYIRTNEVIFTLRYDNDNMLRIIGESDKQITSVKEKLQAANEPQISE